MSNVKEHIRSQAPNGGNFSSAQLTNEKTQNVKTTPRQLIKVLKVLCVFYKYKKKANLVHAYIYMTKYVCI